MIEKLHEEDIERVAEIHMQTMPGGIIGALGYEFLKNVYYKEYINSEYAFGYVYKEGNEALGIATACYNSNKFLKELIKKNKLKLIYYLLKGILKDRHVLRFILERVGKNDFKKDSRVDDNIKKQVMDIKAELMIIAIKPDIRRFDIGIRLHNARLKEFKKNGIRNCKATVSSQNKKIIRFHRQFGGEVLHTFKSHGKEWCLIIYRNI